MQYKNKKCTQSAPSGYLDIISRYYRNGEGDLIYNGDGSTFVEIAKNGISFNVIMANRADEMNFIEMNDLFGNTTHIVKIPDKSGKKQSRLDMVQPVPEYDNFIPNSNRVKKCKKIKNKKRKGKTAGLSKKETKIRKESRSFKYEQNINDDYYYYDIEEKEDNCRYRRRYKRGRRLKIFRFKFNGWGIYGTNFMVVNTRV